MNLKDHEQRIAMLEAGLMEIAQYIGPNCVGRVSRAMRQIKYDDAERDAARFAWLEKNATSCDYIDHANDGFLIVRNAVEGAERYATFGEAIDAAILQESKSAA